MRSRPRLNYIEPLVMLGTILQWMLLASVTGIIVGAGTSVFLHILFLFTNEATPRPLWYQMLLLPSGGFLTGLIMYYGYKLNNTGLDDSVITAVHQQSGRMPFRTLLRSEEHTSELQSLMRISYAVFCLKKKKNQATHK